MNKRDLEPLPTEVGAMLDTLKPVDAVPIDVRTRLRSRVLVSVGGSGGPSGGAAVTPSAPVSKSAGWWLAAGIGVGLTIGIAVFSVATSGERDEVAEPVIASPEIDSRANVATPVREERIEPREAPAVRLSPLQAEVPRVREPVAPLQTPTPAVVRAAGRTASTETETETEAEAETAAETETPTEARTNTASDRAEQRAIVERARGALAAGRTADAASALEEHDRRFAGGPYTEEAAALRVRVLLASGRRDEARERAQRFLERYPNSIFRDVLGPALRE